MKKRISYWFLLGLASWGMIILLRENGMYITIVNDHFTDFITIPMYCYLIEYIMNSLLGYRWRPDLKFVLTSILYLSFLFEVLCPRLSHQFTGDIFDVLAYFSGGMIYYFFRNRSFKTLLFLIKKPTDLFNKRLLANVIVFILLKLQEFII